MSASPIQLKPAAQAATSGILPVLFLLFLGFPTSAVAAGGSFEIRKATARLAEGVYYLDARIDYDLGDKALEALDSGVELTIQLQVEISRRRRFFPDADVARLKNDYQLSYQPLSQRYVLQSLNSGEQSSYATLFSALTALGSVEGVPIIDASLLEPGSQYGIRLRAVLDQNTLPGPLRLMQLWGDSFRLNSKWYAWKLSE